MAPTAKAKRPPCILRLSAPLPSGADVVAAAVEAEELEVLVLDVVVVASELVELVEAPLVVAAVVAEDVSVEVSEAVSELVPVLDALAVLPVGEAVEAVATEVPVAPVIPKLGEKL